MASFPSYLVNWVVKNNRTTTVIIHNFEGSIKFLQMINDKEKLKRFSIAPRELRPDDDMSDGHITATLYLLITYNL